MYIKNYMYKTGSKLIDNTVLIEDIDRDDYMSNSLYAFTNSFITNTVPSGNKCAFIYIAGPSIATPDARNTQRLLLPSHIAIKSNTAYTMYNLIKQFKHINFDYAEIDSNTCASSISALFKAKCLLEQGYTDIILYASDLVNPTEQLLFKQLGIELKLGDAVTMMHITSEVTNMKITDVVFNFNLESSPMSVSKEGYLKVLNQLNLNNVSIVKTHGSGTDINTQAELGAVNEILPNIKTISYKQDIGHTQGASGLVELCKLIEEPELNKAIGLASGLGGFYGGYKIEKYK